MHIPALNFCSGTWSDAWKIDRPARPTFRLGTGDDDGRTRTRTRTDGDGVRDDAIDEGAVDGDGGEHASRGAVHGDVLSRWDDDDACDGCVVFNVIKHARDDDE